MGCQGEVGVACSMAAAGLAEGGGINHLVGQTQAQEPAIGHVDLNFLHQSPLAGDTKEVTDEEHLEQHDGVNSRTTVVRAVEVTNLIADEVEGDELVYFAQQVVLRNEGFESNHLDF